MQPFDRIVPLVAVHEVVPIGNEIPEGTTVVAERDAAIHAPPGLVIQCFCIERLVDLVPVSKTDGNGTMCGSLTLPFEKTGGLTHVRTSLLP